MDFFKKFITNILPVNQIIKFIIKHFLESYLIYNEKDIEEKVEPDTGLKNIINIDELELNVSNINNKHLLHSPIKLLKGKFGKFKLDMDEDNKIIVTIEDVSLELMPIFNFYKKYQEKIFNMEEQKKQTKIEAILENKKASGNIDTNAKANNQNPKVNNSYMLKMANQLLTNLEINIRNIAIQLYMYEVGDKILENPVFTFFILSICIYKNKDQTKNSITLIDPATQQNFEKCFLDNLVIDFDKLCLKLNNNVRKKDLQDFAEIKNFSKKQKNNLTKEQENKILNFFINYNTIFALNYKNGPCLSIKLNLTPRIETYKLNNIEKKKIVEDMNIEINIAEVESIVTPHQLFNIQIFTQISNFIFMLNKNTPKKVGEKENKKVVYKNKSKEKEDKDSDSDSTKDKDKSEKISNDEEDEEEKEKSKFSLMFDKEDKNEEEKELNDDEDIRDKDKLRDINKITNTTMSYLPKAEKVEVIEKEEPKKREVLNHELDKFNITINCKRIVIVSLENKDDESIPKLFSFLMEDEIISKKKNLTSNKEEKVPIENTIFGDSNSSFENYYCYFKDNLLLFKIDKIKSINTCINISSILAEYIQPIDDAVNFNEKKEKEQKEKNSKIQMSVYESAVEFSEPEGGGVEGGMEEGGDCSEVFQSALESTQLLIMENYSRFINKFINGEYKNTKFEILTINGVKYDMEQKLIVLNEFFFNINYMIILLMVRLLSKVQYFFNMEGKQISIYEVFQDEDEENLNINLEKKINDTEIDLLNNLKKKYDKNADNSDEEDDRDIFEESIGYSEEEKQKKDGIKIKINYFSFKVNNIATDPNRFDGNIYYFNLFKDLVFPNLTQIKGDKLKAPQNQYFQDIISQDFIELILVDLDTIFYSINSNSNIHIVFKELLMKYWNETVMKYTNNNNKNDLDTNPNVSITMPAMDILLNFDDKVKMNIDKNTIDNLLSFNNNFLYGLSMYQIYDKYCSELFNNKLLNLFDIFGLKNHIKALKNIKTDEEKKEEENKMNKKINYDKKAIKEIEKEFKKKKPKMSIGGKFSCLILRINKNKSFDLKEGNLIKIKMFNVGFSFEMFNAEENNNNANNDINNNNINNIKSKESKETIHIEKGEPIYNMISVSINNILFLVKESTTSNDNKPKYFNLFSKNKSEKYESTDYFFMTFKFRNMKKTNNDLTIIELDEDEDSDENIDKSFDKQISKESDIKSKNSDKFKEKNMKIALDPKTTDYIAFLLNNQIKLDNMEMIVDVKISETIFNSFYDKLNDISFSLNNFFLDFTNSNKTKENAGPFLEPRDRIPLCEDRLMFFKIDFVMNDLLFDIFLKNDKNKKNWMRLLLSIEQFKFALNENGMFVNIIKDSIFILKDFNYIFSEEQNNIYEIDDKINDIHKEDSYIKRLGYVELFYNDNIELNKKEKEINVNLGNINLFFCKDSYDFLMEFTRTFNNKYLGKIKETFSNNKDEINFPDDDDEEMEKDDNSKEIIFEDVKKEEKKEINKKNEFDDFEVVDDVFFIDDSKKLKENQNKKIQKNYENLYLKKHPNKLETIEEYDKKSKKGKDNLNNMIDDFAIIETKTSLERNINRVQKEEDCITYLLKLDSFRLYLFQGSDFNFEDDPKNDLSIELPKIKNDEEEENNEINNGYIFQDNSLPNEMHIDSNYLFKINEIKKKKIFKNKRKRKDPRDYSNYILLNLIDMEFKIVDFSFYDFSIDNFFIDDKYKKSRYQKIISNKDFLSENSKFLTCKIDLMKINSQIKEKEKTYVRINLSLPSLDIFIDQLPLLFIFKFFMSSNNETKTEVKDTEIKNKDSTSVNNIDIEKEENLSGKNKSSKDKSSDNNNKKNNDELKYHNMKSYDSWSESIEKQDIKKLNSIEEQKEENTMLINEILINSFSIKLNYNSHKISFYSVYQKGDWLEFLSGLSDIKELNLKFKLYRKLTPTFIGDTITDLINFWKDDIISLQGTRSALRGLSITRPFLKLYDGVKDLVKQPYVYYKENKGIKKGIKKGMKNFLVSFSSTGIFFGEKIFRGIRIATFGKTTLSLKKKSLYKAWIYKVNKKQLDYETYYYKQK